MALSREASEYLDGTFPVIDTPFSRMVEHIWSGQYGPCKDYEMDYIRCSARVGHIRAPVECTKYLDDFMECKFKIKTHKRYLAMQEERKKQGKPLLPPPPKDSIHVSVGHQ